MGLFNKLKEAMGITQPQAGQAGGRRTRRRRRGRKCRGGELVSVSAGGGRRCRRGSRKSRRGSRKHTRRHRR